MDFFARKKYTSGADKSLARTGRKKTTANKLGIFSTYSPRSSIHFVVLCSNFCKPLKKSQTFFQPTRSLRQRWSPRRKKNGEISILFSAQGTDSIPTGTDPDNRVGDQDIGCLSRSVSSGFQVPFELGHGHAITKPPWWISRGVFLSKCHSVAPAEMSNTPH